MPNLPHDWITVPEAAEYLKTSPGTIYGAVRSKSLRAARLSVSRRSIRIKQSWLEEFAERCSALAEPREIVRRRA